MYKQRRHLILPQLLLLLFLTPSACKEFERSSRGGGNAGGGQDVGKTQSIVPSAPTPTPTPLREKNLLFIILGGFGSCRFDDNKVLTIGPNEMEMAKAYRNSFSDLEQRGFRVQAIMSCFDVLTADKVRYVLSSDVKKIYYETLDTYSAEVANAIKAQPTRSIYFMGHSYGGWLALRTALQNKPNFNYAGIFTIDPISRTKCNSLTYLATMINFDGKVSNISTYPGCDVAPEDFPTDSAQLIRQSTKSWTNIYQTNFKYLHSSVIPSAGSNIEFQYPTEINPHISIARDPNVWAKIRSVFDLDFPTNN